MIGLAQLLTTYDAEIRADFANCGWSVQNDLGRRLRAADALALVYRVVRDEGSLLADRLRHHDTSPASQPPQADEQEIKKAAKNLNPALRHLFT